VSEADRKLDAILFADIAGYTARMGADEPAAVQMLDRARALVRTSVAGHGGRLLEEIGDGTLADFESAVAAVGCALEIQAQLFGDPELRVRIGIHEGDVLRREGHIFGDGVNVASRIHELAQPGGICVSERVYEDVRNQPGLRAARLGPRHLKNVDRPVVVYVLGTERPRRRRALRPAAIAAAAVLVAIGGLALSPLRDELLVAYVVHVVPLFSRKFEQRIGFATTGDGVRIAYATAGSGPPLVWVLGWFTHLERGLDSPAYDSHISRLVGSHRVVRYDGRGTGLSDRDVEDFSLEARVRDLEAVVDAAGLTRFALYGISVGGPTAVTYAARHPERVTRLVLPCTYARAQTVLEHQPAWEGIIRMLRLGGREGAASGERVLFSLVAPDASPVARELGLEMWEMSTPGPTAGAIAEASRPIDVTPLLASLRMPTLVVHAERDLVVPLPAGRELAAGIPGARFVVVDTNNHALPPIDAGGRRAQEEIEAFLAADESVSAASP
jgi:class 3 adenylate cyclase/pimeloyl-ACP methyl ester carboxylesterase